MNEMYYYNILMKRSDLAKIAKYNQEYITECKINVPATVKVLYDQIPIKECKLTKNTIVSFEPLKTDDCAIKYLTNNLSKNIVAMNFASGHSHGGGYTKGATAQEEDLCRVIPQLYPSLLRIRYPFECDTVLITPNVDIVRNNIDYNFFRDNSMYNISIISAAAPNLRYESFDENRVIRTLENMYVSVKYILYKQNTFLYIKNIKVQVAEPIRTILTLWRQL